MGTCAGGATRAAQAWVPGHPRGGCSSTNSNNERPWPPSWHPTCRGSPPPPPKTPPTPQGPHLSWKHHSSTPSLSSSSKLACMRLYACCMGSRDGSSQGQRCRDRVGEERGKGRSIVGSRGRAGRADLRGGGAGGRGAWASVGRSVAGRGGGAPGAVCGVRLWWRLAGAVLATRDTQESRASSHSARGLAPTGAAPAGPPAARASRPFLGGAAKRVAAIAPEGVPEGHAESQPLLHGLAHDDLISIVVPAPAGVGGAAGSAQPAAALRHRLATRWRPGGGEGAVSPRGGGRAGAPEGQGVGAVHALVLNFGDALEKLSVGLGDLRGGKGCLADEGRGA